MEEQHQNKAEKPEVDTPSNTQAEKKDNSSIKDSGKEIHRGVYIADERKKGKGGFVKCKSLDKKIQINLRRDDDLILHQTEVEWVQITRYNRKQRREKNKQQRQKRQNKYHGKTQNKKYQPKFVEKKEPAKLKYKAKEQIQQKKDHKEQNQLKKTPKNEEVIPEPIPKEEESVQSQKQSQPLSEICTQLQKLNINEDQTQKKDKNQEEERQDLSSDSEQQEDKQEDKEGNTQQKKQKKEQDDIVIVGKVVKRTSCEYWQKPFVAIMKFEEINRKKTQKKYKEKNQSHVQKILNDFYLDAEPIHPRLPYFEIQRCKQTIQIIEKYVEKNIKFAPDAKGGKIRNQILDQMESVYALVKYNEINGSMAYCNLLKIIGKTKTVEGECNCFLYEHQLNDFEHIDNEQEQSKEQLQLNISPWHKKFDEMVFTIDPPTSTDLDDALSIRKLQNDEFQIGIHIADVSSYMKFIKREQIVKRTTSVYLPNWTYHMLPSYLVKICSLNPDVERLAFSIYVKMNLQGKITGQSRFQKNILKSRFKLSYDEAQNILTGKSDYPSFQTSHPCTENEYQVLVEKLGFLGKIGLAHRNQRMLFDVFENREIKFEFDENKWPVSFTIENRFSAQKIIEEYMIIGNMEAARKLVSLDPTNALIIHHPRPSAYAIKSFNEYFEFLGIDFKFESVKQLQQDLQKVQQLPNISQQQKQLCYFKARRAQETASYKLYSEIPQIDNKQQIIHFALGLSFYTHFTSPMRRIGDIMVHETLASSVIPECSILKLKQQQVSQANWGRTRTKRLKKDLNEIFLCLLIYHTRKRIKCEGIVVSLGLRSVSIFIPMLDMVKQIYWYEIDVNKAVRNKETDKIQVIVHYDKRDAKKDIIWKIQKCEKVSLEIGCTEDPPLRLAFNLEVENTNKGKRRIRSRM